MQKVAKPIIDAVIVHLLGCEGNAASHFFEEMEDKYLMQIQDDKLFEYIYIYVSFGVYFRQVDRSISFM